MTEEEYSKASDLEQILFDRTGMLAKNHPDIVEAMEQYADKFKNLNLHLVSNNEVAVCQLEYSADECERYSMLQTCKGCPWNKAN